MYKYILETSRKLSRNNLSKAEASQNLSNQIESSIQEEPKLNKKLTKN